VFAGTDPRSGNGYVYLETLGGGMGARAGKDGKDAVHVHITNTSNLPVEAIEMEYPLLVETYALVKDSGGAGRYRGGAGRYRGGAGLRRSIRPLDHECVFSGHGERFRHHPWGIFGGGQGSKGRFVLIGDDGGETDLPSKPLGVTFGPHHRIVIETPGAGGYGPPGERDPVLVSDDARSGKFTAAVLESHYPAQVAAMNETATR